MKRVILIILCLLLLVGCGKAKKNQRSDIEQIVPESESSQEEQQCPEYMSQEIFDYGLKALDIGEQCFKAEISFEDAKKKIDQIDKLASDWYYKHNEDNPDNTLDIVIIIDINSIRAALSGHQDLEDSIESLREHLKGI